MTPPVATTPPVEELARRADEDRAALVAVRDRALAAMAELATLAKQYEATAGHVLQQACRASHPNYVGDGSVDPYACVEIPGRPAITTLAHLPCRLLAGVVTEAHCIATTYALGGVAPLRAADVEPWR